MQISEVMSAKYSVLSGTVESVGDERTFGCGSLIRMLQFTDGSFLRNVRVDWSVGPYVKPGQKLDLAYVKSGKNNLVLAIDTEDYGFRGADAEKMKKGNGQASGLMLLFGMFSVFTLIPVYSEGFNAFTIRILVGGIPLYLVTAVCVGSLGWSSRIQSLIDMLYQQRSVFPH